MEKNVTAMPDQSIVMTPDIPQDLPTVIRGCMFDDGWEFDAPCIIYYPFFKYGDGGNTGHLDNMVEDVCIDLSIDDTQPDFNSELHELEHECEWRGWSMKGFQRRKNAWHVELRLRWFRKPNGELDFEITERLEQRGPFRSS